MSALEDFKKTFKDAVTGNKLSSSRVEATKKASMKCYDRSQLVKPEVLKIHLEASSSSSKICSLYLFDAIVRHAQSIVSGKKGSIDEGEAIKLLASISKSSDPKQALVSAAEDFLDEMGTIVVDIITDTVKSVKPESRDKVEKVIEIWKKASTFKPNLLQELDSAVKFASASSSRSTHSNGASSKTSGRSSKGDYLGFQSECFGIALKYIGVKGLGGRHCLMIMPS